MIDRECVALLQWALPRLGLHWPGFRRVRRQVCRRVARRMGELGLPDAAAYRARLEADPGEWAVLDTCCRVSVSRFWRDRGVFEQLADQLLPELALAALGRRSPAVAAWSAGCASGEEPYSLRLAWDLAVAPAFPEVELRILASDASRALVERARRGVYGGSAMKDLPVAWRARAFEALDGDWRLRDGFRHDLELRCEDLRERMPDGPFDLILCRNLAFTYFGEDLRRTIAAGLTSRLRPGGALLVGIHERLPELAGVALDERVPGLYRAPSESQGGAS